MIKHLDGTCHVYIDDGADEDMAEPYAVNAKTQRYGTCNTYGNSVGSRDMACS